MSSHSAAELAGSGPPRRTPADARCRPGRLGRADHGRYPSLRLCAIRQEGCAAHFDRRPSGRRPPGDGGSQSDPDDDAPFARRFMGSSASPSITCMRWASSPNISSATISQLSSVVSPDLGNAKSAAAFAKRLEVPMAAGAKERLSDTEVRISMLIGDVRGRDVIVLDDEIVSGGSILELLRHLRDHKARSIRIACTHGIPLRFRHPAARGGARTCSNRLHGHGSHCRREAGAEADGVVHRAGPGRSRCAGSTPANSSALVPFGTDDFKTMPKLPQLRAQNLRGDGLLLSVFVGQLQGNGRTSRQDLNMGRVGFAGEDQS